jgi:hypothetical protein
MTPHRLLNWTLALAITILVGLVHHLDLPSEAQARIDTARALRWLMRRPRPSVPRAALADAQAEAERAARFERAARAMCGGENGAWSLLPDGAVQCFTHRGFKTRIVKAAL